MENEEKERVMPFATDARQESKLKRGFQEGFEQGFREQRQDNIIRVLEVRFENVLLDLRGRIERIDDLEVLKSLLEQAVISPLLEEFSSAIQTLEENKKMPYITSVERRGIEKGQITKGQEDIIRLLEVRLQEDIELNLREIIQRTDDLEVLGTLFVQAITTPSLEEFESVVNQLVAEEESSESEDTQQSLDEGDDESS